MPRTSNLSALLIAGCLAAAVMGACGSARLETHQVEPFHSVDIRGSMTVVVEPGAGPGVQWTEGGEAISVRDGVLRLAPTGGGPAARVVTPGLRGISVDGDGKVEVDAAGIEEQRLELNVSGAGRVAVHGVRTEVLRVDISGTPAVTVSGAAGHLELVGDGGGEIDLAGLCVETAEVDLGGPARATVIAGTRIDARLVAGAALRYFAPHELGDQPGKVERLADGGDCAR